MFVPTWLGTGLQKYAHPFAMGEIIEIGDKYKK
jgi:hypothetical protein